MPAHFRDRRAVEGLAQLNSLFRDHVTNISLNRPPRSWAKSERCRMCFRTLSTSTCTRRLCSKKCYQCTATIHARRQQDYEAAAGVLPDGAAQGNQQGALVGERQEGQIIERFRECMAEWSWCGRFFRRSRFSVGGRVWRRPRVVDGHVLGKVLTVHLTGCGC